MNMGQVDSMLFERYDDVEKYDVKVALSDLNALESVETELTRHNEVYRAEGKSEGDNYCKAKCRNKRLYGY